MNKVFTDRVSVLKELGLSEPSLDKVLNYLNFLWAANAQLNLFSRQTTAADLIDNHLIDCLLPLKRFPKDVQSVADFGSGGGLPGVLYAILFPHIRFHLYEKSPKKQDFLVACAEDLAPNIKVHGLIPTALPQVDLIMSRAFKPLLVILDLSRDHYANQRGYFLLKGRHEKIQTEIDEAKSKFKDLAAKVEKLSSPVLDVERHLVTLHIN